MSYNKGLVATLPELEAFYKGQDAGAIIELMNQTNDILTDIPWMESNQSEGHLTRIRSKLPDVYWRKLYAGVPPSKGSYTQVREGCGMLEARMELDKREIELYGDKAAAYRLSESKAFTESMRQKVATTLIYGNQGKNPDEFNGFAIRCPKIGDKVFSGGGSTANKQTSMYLVSWGSDTVHGIYPKGSTAGLTHEDIGEIDAIDSSSNRFRAVCDIYGWKCGLALRDWRSVIRIANIDSTKLTLRKGETGFIDLQALTIQAKNAMPAQMRANAIWYCNQEVMTALELQALDYNAIHLVYGEMFASKQVPFLHGRPIRQCDAIVNTEAVIS